MKMGKYKELANQIGELVDVKNAAYGNSFEEAGAFLKLLYPDGIPPEKYGDMLCVVRIFDKLKRIATKKDAFGESPYQDIVGYGLLGTQRDNEISEHRKLLDITHPTWKAARAVHNMHNFEIVAFDGRLVVTPEIVIDLWDYYKIDMRDLVEVLLKFETDKKLNDKSIDFKQTLPKENGKTKCHVDILQGSDIIWSKDYPYEAPHD